MEKDSRCKWKENNWSRYNKCKYELALPGMQETSAFSYISSTRLQFHPTPSPSPSLNPFITLLRQSLRRIALIRRDRLSTSPQLIIRIRGINDIRPIRHSQRRKPGPWAKLTAPARADRESSTMDAVVIGLRGGIAGYAVEAGCCCADVGVDVVGVVA